MLRLDVPRRDPTAVAALRSIDKPREVPRPLLRRYSKCGALVATVAECIAAKGGHRRAA